MRTAEAVAEIAVQSRRVIGSADGVRNSDEDVAAGARESFNRSDRPMGVARQYAAILAQPRWHERLSSVSVPTLVLHGAIDPLIRPACGEDIASRIPDAEVELIDGWGHDMPKAMAGRLVEQIAPFLKANEPG
jgi:pimeloyl-ACP methyl ester carboxylesterase